jgi:hypothetical protein
MTPTLVTKTARANRVFYHRHLGGLHFQAWDGCGQKEKGHGRLGDSSHVGPPPFFLPVAVPIHWGRSHSVPNCSGEVSTSGILEHGFPNSFQALFGFSHPFQGGGVYPRSPVGLMMGEREDFFFLVCFGLFWVGWFSTPGPPLTPTSLLRVGPWG